MGDRAGRKAKQKHQLQQEQVKNQEKRAQANKQQPRGGPVTKVQTDRQSG